MKKGIIAIMMVVCIGLAGATAYIMVNADKEKPVISFGQEEITFARGEDTAILLSDVIAVDKKDGDVSASLLVEGVYPDDTGTEATVVYVAKDESNNIAKAKRTVKYSGDGTVVSQPAAPAEETAPQPEVPQPEAKEEKPEAGNSTEVQKEPKEAEIETKETEKKEEDTQTEEEEQISPESPRITLTESKVVLSVGEELERLSYVDEIVDDKDERSELFQNIQINSDDLNVNKAGTYEVIYYAVDQDGNKSNEAVLTVVVE